MTKADSTERKKHYQKSLESHGHSPKALQWASYKAAAIRYRELVADVDIEGKTILDAGCGMGDLLPYLYAKTLNFNYLGVDVTPEFIDIASKRYYGNNFKVANPFADDFNEKFDVVLSSGVMNSKSPNWLEERKAMIAKLFLLTNETLVFNMAGGTNPDEQKNVAYASSAEIKEFCLSLTPNVTLRDGYHSKDFTMILHKD